MNYSQPFNQSIPDGRQSPQSNITPPSYQDLPNATTTLVMGILSIAGCWLYGVVSFILAIIGIVMGSKGKKLYAQHPELYTSSSYKNLKAGYTMSIIGLVLSSFWLIIIIFYIIIFIFALSSSFPIFDDLDFTNLMIM
ncbi:MAG TPA: DUF4190 domain-containing protein [Bacteroidales bacterium]|nr:DUF4190 domain-containing protein [Bacteroidales bacterium]